MSATKKLTGLAAALLLAGCVDVELEIPVSTGVSTVPGDENLYSHQTTLHDALLAPLRIDDGLGLGDQDLSSATLVEFQLDVPACTVAGTDTDDLGFIQSMTIFVEPLSTGSRLPRLPIAWYVKGKVGAFDGTTVLFDVDSGIELLEYVQEGFLITATSEAAVPHDDVSIEGTATFVALPAR